MSPFLKELTVSFLILIACVKPYLTKLLMKTRPDAMAQHDEIPWLCNFEAELSQMERSLGTEDLLRCPEIIPHGLC